MKLNLISFVDFRYSFRARQLLIEIEPFQKCVKIQNCLKVGQWNPFNPLSANPTNWPNTLKQFNLSVFGHFVNLALKGLKLVKNVFYFVLKAIFVFKIFQFLP